MRTDPQPVRDSSDRIRQALVRSLPLAASLGLVAMWIIPGAGPWPLIASGILTPAAMMFASRTAAQKLPDPASFRRHGTSSTPADPSTGWRLDLGNATHRWARRTKIISLQHGDVLGIAGPGAAGLSRWVRAQLIAYGGQPKSTVAGGAENNFFIFPAANGAFSADPSAPHVTVITAPTPTLLPHGVTISITASAGHNRDLSESWFDAATQAAETVALPANADVREHLPADVATTWQRSDSRLCTPIGVGLNGESLELVEVDLAGDSPHAVIAGTTGAGKSELLTAWLLGLAMRYPPAHVTMALVDYKGGATFGALARLPHVLDVLTDLDHDATTRALESLRVEIQRRERLFSQAEVANLSEYNAQAREPIARLIIAVDEFRVLADEYPDVLEQVMRVAAQGRSLGLHVILATQRPGGTMTPDIRANMGLRACLRVVEETDSIDILGTPAAARLPATPGRMILLDEHPRTVQTLWAGDDCMDLVKRCGTAAAELPHLARLHRPWAPPLPTHLVQIPAAPPGEITLGLADLPAEQRHGPWTIHPHGLLAISGDAGSGRTSAARVVALDLMQAGIAVHTIAHAPLLPGAPGSHVSPSDPPACYALLRALGESEGADALIIDDLNSALEAIDEALGMGEAPGFMHELLRTTRRRGGFVAVTTGLPIPSWLSPNERLVFPPTDPQQRLLAGLSASKSPPPPPGRALALRNAREVAIQVPLLDPNAARSAKAALAAPSFTVRPVPRRVDIPADSALGLCIGIDSEGAHVTLPCEPGKVTLLVAQPGGGKTHLGRLILARASLAGRPANSVTFIDDLQLAAHEDLDAHAVALEHGAHLVIAATPEGLSSGFHPILTRVRHAEHTIYLGLMPRSVVGINLATYIAPGIIGRAALAHRGRMRTLQIDSGAALLEPAPR